MTTQCKTQPDGVLAEFFEVGDVLLDERAAAVRRYVVAGWTARGKLRLRRTTGSERQVWWFNEEALPAGWRVLREVAAS